MTERMDCFTIRAGVFSWGRLFGKFPVLKRLYNGYQQRRLKKYLLPQHGIGNSVFTDDYAGVYRDHHYRKYKTYTTTQVIKIGAATLWIKINNALIIGDISVLAGDFDSMIHKLKKLTRKLGIKEIQFHSSPNTTLHTLFAKQFNANPSFPVIFKDLEGGARLNKIKFTSADIDTF